MFNKSISALTLVLAAGLPLAASAQPVQMQPAPAVQPAQAIPARPSQPVGSTLLPAQTVINGSLEQSIDSRSANVADRFILDLQAPFPADDERYAGAKVYGHVATVTHASASRKGAVTLAFDRLVLADGTAASISGDVLSFDAQGNKANKTAKTIGGAVVGQILGNYIGKHIGSNIGGAVGAIGGGILAANSGQNVTIAQGSKVELKTTSNATVLARRQSGPAPTPVPTPYH